MSTGSKLVAGAMGVLLVGIVGGVGIFLPNFSQAAKDGEEARRQLRMKHVEHTSGGMWKNLNDRVKMNKEGGGELQGEEEASGGGGGVQQQQQK